MSKQNSQGIYRFVGSGKRFKRFYRLLGSERMPGGFCSNIFGKDSSHIGGPMSVSHIESIIKPCAQSQLLVSFILYAFRDLTNAVDWLLFENSAQVSLSLKQVSWMKAGSILANFLVQAVNWNKSTANLVESFVAGWLSLSHHISVAHISFGHKKHKEASSRYYRYLTMRCQGMFKKKKIII